MLPSGVAPDAVLTLSVTVARWLAVLNVPTAWIVASVAVNASTTAITSERIIMSITGPFLSSALTVSRHVTHFAGAAHASTGRWHFTGVPLAPHRKPGPCRRTTVPITRVRRERRTFQPNPRPDGQSFRAACAKDTERTDGMTTDSRSPRDSGLGERQPSLSIRHPGESPPRGPVAMQRAGSACLGLT
jgi:hypothetical protein